MTDPVSDSVLDLFERDPSARLTLRRIRAALPGVSGVAEAVDSLVASGSLWLVGRGRYALASALGISSGSLRVRASGSGVVTTQGMKVEIPSSKLGGAIDGDTVLVRRTDQTGVSRWDGAILSVLERRRKGVSGVLRKAGGGWVLDPLDPTLPRGLPIERCGGPQGSVAWGRFQGDGLMLEMTESLGAGVTPALLITSVARDMGFSAVYPGDALEIAARAAASPPPTQARTDLRGLLCFTIDPVDARDFDDAVSLTVDEDGYELGVHIADVASFVRPGTALDDEARRRGTSVYLPDRVYPMLPEVLSNDACSLQPGVDRLTRSVFLRYDARGRRRSFRIAPTVIRSSCRLTYEQALAAMNGEELDCPGVTGCLGRMAGLSRILSERGRERGALGFGSSEFRVQFGEDGMPSSFERVPDDESHELIENFMVEANRAVAEHCGWLGLSVLYRIHDEPSPEAVTRLRQSLTLIGLGSSVPKRAGHAELAALLAKTAGLPSEGLVKEAVLRSMMKAVYSPFDTGHFGLALRNYLHFTSPIRRYPDLIVHRALEEAESGTGRRALDTQDAARTCSEAEQTAERAERDCTELMALAFLEGRAGSVFRGVVSSSEDFGTFVRLLDVPVEGMIPARYRGASGAHRPGSPMDVEVVSSDPLLRLLSLRPAGIGR